MSSITTTSVNAATADAQSQMQQAAQSIISGSTGNSKMDVGSLVSALVNAKTAGQSAALQARQTTDTTTLSAYGALTSALTALQAAIKNLSDGKTLATFAATASGKGLDPKAGAGAVAGSYTIDVKQIAASQSLSSAAFGATTQLGTGTLTISVGGKSMDVTIDDKNNTLSGIAAAINKAGNNPGVTATIVTGTGGAHLVLRAANPGSANTIDVTTGNVQNDAGLSSLGVKSTPGKDGAASSITSADSGNAWHQSEAAQDAAHHRRHRCAQCDQRRHRRDFRRVAESVERLGRHLADADDRTGHLRAEHGDHEFRQPVQHRRHDHQQAVFVR